MQVSKAARIWRHILIDYLILTCQFGRVVASKVRTVGFNRCSEKSKFLLPDIRLLRGMA